MRKAILFALFAAFTMTASAQVEIMVKRIVEPDAMKESAGGTVWASEHIAMMASGNDAVICLFCKEHIFANEPFKLGFYDESDSLRLFIRSWHAKIESDGQTATLVANGFSNDSIEGAEAINGRLGKYMIPVKSVVDYVTSHKGYIRVLATAYGGHPYEVRAAIKED